MFVVSNPVDILTRLAIDHLKRDPNKTIGLGTQLDTARFRSLIALETGLPPSQVKALILGEHGDSMVPIWSSATAAGMPLVKFPNFGAAVQQRVFERTKTSGAEAIKLKGGAGWAVGLTIAEVIHAIALNQPKILPISHAIDGRIRHQGNLHQPADADGPARRGEAPRDRTVAARNHWFANRREVAGCHIFSIEIKKCIFATDKNQMNTDNSILLEHFSR